MSQIIFNKQSAPATPATGLVSVYVDSTTNKLTTKDDSGTITNYGAYILPFGVFVSLSPMTAAAAPYAAPVHTSMTLLKNTYTVQVATTNNGSNYWRLRLLKVDGTQVQELNTSAISASTYTIISSTSFDISSLTTSDVGLQISCVKVGTPGDLYMNGCPILEVR